MTGKARGHDQRLIDDVEYKRRTKIRPLPFHLCSCLQKDEWEVGADVSVWNDTLSAFEVSWTRSPLGLNFLRPVA